MEESMAMHIMSPMALLLATTVGTLTSPSLAAQGARRPPDNPAGNVNSHLPDARPAIGVRYLLPIAVTAAGTPDTAGLGARARVEGCIDRPLLAYITFTSRTAFVLYDSTATFCVPETAGAGLTRRDRISRRAGEFAITGGEFSGWFPEDADVAGRVTGWFAGDTLYLDQDCDQGGLPYVREHRAQGPHAHPLQGVRWLSPCG